MTQTLFPVVAFVVLLALVPFGLRRWQRRLPGQAPAAGLAVRVVSAAAVGPQQRVVTVEVGPAQARTWLVLGVTAQNITCLHTLPASAAQPQAGDAAAGTAWPVGNRSAM